MRFCLKNIMSMLVIASLSLPAMAQQAQPTNTTMSPAMKKEIITQLNKGVPKTKEMTLICFAESQQAVAGLGQGPQGKETKKGNQPVDPLAATTQLSNQSQTDAAGNVDNTVSEGPKFNYSILPADKKAKVAQSVMFDKSVKFALRTSFTGNSDVARKKVAGILAKHHCNAALVDTIPLSTWGVPPVLGPESGKVNTAQVQETLILKSAGNTDYVSLVEDNQKMLNLTDEDMLTIHQKWQTVGHAGRCGGIIADVQKFCSGENNAIESFEKFKQQYDDPAAVILEGIIIGVAVGLTVLAAQKIVEHYENKAAKIQE